MQTPSSSHPKPVTDWWRPDLVQLPRLTPARRLARRLLQGVARLLVFLKLEVTFRGLENFPTNGPALIVMNHLGDADAVLLAAAMSRPIDALGKIELNDHWLVGPVFRLYGIIFVHRGQPDRKALRAALDGLAEGRIVAMAPEGRQAVEGRLEAGMPGAAFLALKSGAPIVPVAMTGTENENIYGRKWWQRAGATLAVGQPFKLEPGIDRQVGTEQIMQALAELLPESYRSRPEPDHR